MDKQQLLRDYKKQEDKMCLAQIIDKIEMSKTRGIKHIEELIKAKEQGYNTVIAFVIQMDNVKYFTPNNVTHKAFGDALIKAYNSGVEILCLDCNVTEESLKIKDKVDYKL